MDWVVHINNGSMEAKPIVLRLLPGEETIFNLKVVNHGEPSNISLVASNPVFKAVRLRKPDHYVVTEETIPIMARMPSNKSRLVGEILLTSSSGENHVPITLLRDSEDPGDDLEDPKVQVDEDLADEQYGNRSDATGDAADDDEDEDLDDLGPAEARDRYGREDDGSNDDLDDNSEDRSEGNSDDEEDDYDRIMPRKDPDSDEDEREPRRIVFSKDKDLQRYRSATRPKKQDKNADDNADDNADELIPYIDRKDPAEVPEDGFMEGQRRFRDRLAGREAEHLDEGRVEDRSDLPLQSPSFASSQDGYQTYRQDQARDAGGYGSSYSSQYPSSNEAPSETNEVEGDYLENVENEGPGGLFGNYGDFGALQIIPIVIFLALVVVLVLTFITESIPEFPGALGSSILIVTLIIYGAATLLKA
ncbi:MAG: hypothetical protein EHM14_14065 [Methanothrix sp.]|nr:MAG: hypothetical protein EHM14_14065 [Methanothrix sp.]